MMEDGSRDEGRCKVGGINRVWSYNCVEHRLVDSFLNSLFSCNIFLLQRRKRRVEWYDELRGIQSISLSILRSPLCSLPRKQCKYSVHASHSIPGGEGRGEAKLVNVFIKASLCNQVVCSVIKISVDALDVCWTLLSSGAGSISEMPHFAPHKFIQGRERSHCDGGLHNATASPENKTGRLGPRRDLPTLGDN